MDTGTARLVIICIAMCTLLGGVVVGGCAITGKPVPRSAEDISLAGLSALAGLAVGTTRRDGKECQAITGAPIVLTTVPPTQPVTGPPQP